MLVRVTVLFLLFAVLYTNSKRTHDSPKRRRFSPFARTMEEMVSIRDFNYKRMSASRVNETKWDTAKNLVNHFLEASSTENYYFDLSAKWIESISSPDMIAEICGHNDMMNAFQYHKYMRQAATQYKKVPTNITVKYDVIESGKQSLKVYVMFEHTDKNGIPVTMHYAVILNATFIRGFDDSIFSITHITQGGSCLEHGLVTYHTSQPEDVERFLEEHPDGKLFLNLFAPRVFEYSEDTKFLGREVNHLPAAWLLAIENDAEIGVCHEGETNLVDYTPEQFRSWYQRFGQMWHGKDGDDEVITMQGLDVKDGTLHARVTMRLQIGTNLLADIHEWHFKMTAKLNAEKAWKITKINVLCPSTIKNLMDLNFLAYRDVFGATFNLYLKDREQWYPATDFAKHFKKYGETVEFSNCFKEVTNEDDLSKKFWVDDRFWQATIIGYFNTYQLTTPADEDTHIILRIKMRPPTQTPVPGDIFGSDWKFYIKWDKMDQFYYFYKAEFSCPQYMKPGDGSFRIFTRYRGIVRYC